MRKVTVYWTGQYVNGFPVTECFKNGLLADMPRIGKNFILFGADAWEASVNFGKILDLTNLGRCLVLQTNSGTYEIHTYGGDASAEVDFSKVFTKNAVKSFSEQIQ